MNATELKQYIYENNKIQEVLEEIGCHHVKWHSSGYFTAANKDGDNKQGITIYSCEALNVINYTRDLPIPSDIITLTEYNLGLNFFQAFKYLCDFLEIDPYAIPEDNLPESLKITKMLIKMMNKEQDQEEDETPIKVLPESVLSYYRFCVNDMFLKDGISYKTQKDFLLGYDDETNRITIPVFDELGNLVSIKGRILKHTLCEDDLKYIYLYPCPRNKILFGLNKTWNYIKQESKVFISESEKGVMQLWSYGYKNSVATGGTKIGKNQIEKIIRLGVQIIFAFDQDITEDKLENIGELFFEKIPIYAIIDKNGILSEKESPSDSKNKWEYLVKNHIYRIR